MQEARMGLQATYLALMNIDDVRDRIKAVLSYEALDVALALRLCNLSRQHGCGVLLADMDVAGFRAGLIESAQIYQRVLDAAEAGQKLDPYYLTRTQAEPLFDALAAGNLPLAKSIAERLPKEWKLDLEPAEDSFFMAVIAALIAGEPARQQLEEMEKTVTQGPRWAIATSLVNLASEAFEEALAELIEEQRSRVAGRRQGSRIDPYDDATTANLFVQGIALVRLARHLGIRTADQYPLIPDVCLA
jgi:hypothetical protein